MVTGEPGTRAGCPDLEELAAFLDHRLEGAERAAVVQHLEACEACREVVMESARFALEQEPAGRRLDPPAGVWRAGAWSRRIAVAAAALLAVAVVLWWRAPWRQPAAEGQLAAIVAGLEEIEPARLAVPEGRGWSYLRGESLAPRNRRQGSFRWGVLTVELEVTLARDDRAAALSLLRELESVGRALEDSGILAGLYRDLRRQAEQGAAADELVRSARLAGEWTGRLEAVEGRLFTLGAWASAGRMAAAAGEAGYFQGSPIRRIVRQLASAQVAPELEQTMTEVAGLADGPLADRQLTTLERALAELIAQGGNL